MPTEQFTGTLQFDRPRNVVTASQLLSAEYRLKDTSTENQLIVQQYLSLDPDNVAQQNTITITAGSDGDIYDVEIDDGTNNDSYSYRQTGTMSASAIATALAKRIDLHPGIRARAIGNVITAQAIIPGVTLVLDKSASTVPASVAIAETVAPVGTPLHRLISETKINWTTDQAGLPKTNYQTTFFNGATTSVVTNNGALFEGKGVLGLDQIQTNNGVARP
jgi:hypothetical protein